MKIIWQMVPEIWSTTDRHFCQFGHFWVILCHFLPFYPTNKPQNQNFQKEKKNYLEMSTFYTCVPKIMIIWCMLPEIWSTTVTFLCHFGPFFAFTSLTTLKTKIWKNIKNPLRYYPFTHMHHTWRWYDVWFLRYRAWQKEFFVILGHFSTSDIPNNLKNQNFEKMKKNSGNIIILNMCTINENHMINGSWDMEHNRHTFLSFWPFWVNLGHFCPFTPNNPRNQDWKKEKNPWRYHFTQGYQKPW